MKLVYFNGRGFAETSRLLLKLKGVSFEDYRYPIEIKDWKNHIIIKEDFDNDKKKNLLLNSLNKVPYLRLDDGKIICQSKSIERYLSKKYDMIGNSLEQEALIDSICETIRDYKDMYQKVKRENDHEKIDKFFEETLIEKWELLEHILCLENENFSVGKKISLADIVIFSFVTDYFDAKHLVLRSINKFEKIKNIVGNISSDENIKNWLKCRPITSF